MNHNEWVSLEFGSLIIEYYLLFGFWDLGFRNLDLDNQQTYYNDTFYFSTISNCSSH